MKRKQKATEQTYKLAVKMFVETFRDQIESDSDMNGADTVDQVVSIYHQFKALLDADRAVQS
jgi:hypothetical protein